MCSAPLGIIASEEINWRARGGRGDQDKILKINKACVWSLESDSFHLVIVFYFTLYLFFRSLWNSDGSEGPSKASLAPLCNAERCLFKLFLKLQLSVITDTMLDAVVEIKFIFALLTLKIAFFFINKQLWQKEFNRIFLRSEKKTNSTFMIWTVSSFLRYRMLSRDKPVAADWWQIGLVPPHIVSNEGGCAG